MIVLYASVVSHLSNLLDSNLHFAELFNAFFDMTAYFALGNVSVSATVCKINQLTEFFRRKIRFCLTLGTWWRNLFSFILNTVSFRKLKRYILLVSWGTYFESNVKYYSFGFIVDKHLESTYRKPTVLEFFKEVPAVKQNNDEREK